MAGDAGGGFFTHHPTGGPRAPVPPPTPSRSPVLGIAACLLVGAGLAITALGGNQGGLLGMPLLMLGMVLGAVAWGRGLGAVWGQIAVLATLGLVGLAVLAEILRF